MSQAGSNVLWSEPAHPLQNESSSKYVLLIQMLAELENKTIHYRALQWQCCCSGCPWASPCKPRPLIVSCSPSPHHQYPSSALPLPRSLILLQHHQNCCVLLITPITYIRRYSDFSKPVWWCNKQEKAIKIAEMCLSRWGEVSLQWGQRGRWEGHTQPWKKANLLMEFDHAKLVEVPLEHQMPHYNIFTEVPAIPRKSFIPF